MTAVMAVMPECLAFAGLASMGPRSDDRGYASISNLALSSGSSLQWVRGRMTAVMGKRHGSSIRPKLASMGPRSDDRGYVGAPRCDSFWAGSFNGSAVG